jgi:hypothetical protein
MKFLNGDVYDGEWFDNKRRGRGTLKYSDGTVYDGDWRDNEKMVKVL